jgi:polysaccharide transporter, PST family
MGRHVLGALLNVALNYLLITRWGAIGAALATTSAFAVAHVLANAIDVRTRPIFRIQMRALFFMRPTPTS